MKGFWLKLIVIFVGLAIMAASIFLTIGVFEVALKRAMDKGGYRCEWVKKP